MFDPAITKGNVELAAFLAKLAGELGVGLLGNVYFVVGASDQSYDQFYRDNQKTYADGSQSVHNTLAAAYTAASSNRNDVIVLNTHNTHTLTEMLTVSKNRLHFVGADFGIARRYGQGAKVSLTATTGATNIATVLNTGVRNTFRNIKFINSSTVTEGIYCFADGGEYTYMENCELYKSTDLDQTGAAELVANGDSSHYKDCYIGSTVDAISGAIIRPCVTFSRGLAASGKVARDVTFENCIFARKAGNTANRFVYGAEANAIERMVVFLNCIFFNIVVATIPAQNVAFGSSLTDGAVLLNNCVAVGGATAMSTTTGVYVNGSVPAADTTGIALQAS